MRREYARQWRDGEDDHCQQDDGDSERDASDDIGEVVHTQSHPGPADDRREHDRTSC